MVNAMMNCLLYIWPTGSPKPIGRNATSKHLRSTNMCVCGMVATMSEILQHYISLFLRFEH